MAKKIKRARKSLFKSQPRALDLLPQALALHQAGDLNGAAELYKQILKQQPKNGDALNLAGALALQQKNTPQALKYLRVNAASTPSRESQELRHCEKARQARSGRPR